MDLTPEHVYRSCAEAAWEAPGTQRLWNGNQRETYIELMLARPDWRVLVDVAYRSGWGDHSTLVHDDRAAHQAGREDAARTALREYADRHHHLAGGHGPISTPGGWIDPDAWCSCGAAWSDDEGGCSERIQLMEAISLGRSAGGVGDNPEEQRPALQHQERSEEE